MRQNGVMGYSRLAKRRDPAATRNPLARKIGKALSEALTIDALIDLTDSYKTSKTTCRSFAKITRSPSFPTSVGLISGHVLGRVIHFTTFASGTLQIHLASIKIHRWPYETWRSFNDRFPPTNPSNLAAFLHGRFLFLMMHHR